MAPRTTIRPPITLEDLLAAQGQQRYADSPDVDAVSGAGEITIPKEDVDAAVKAAIEHVKTMKERQTPQASSSATPSEEIEMDPDYVGNDISPFDINGQINKQLSGRVVTPVENDAQQGVSATQPTISLPAGGVIRPPEPPTTVTIVKGPGGDQTQIQLPPLTLADIIKAQGQKTKTNASETPSVTPSTKWNGTNFEDIVKSLRQAQTSQATDGSHIAAGLGIPESVVQAVVAAIKQPNIGMPHVPAEATVPNVTIGQAHAVSDGGGPGVVTEPGQVNDIEMPPDYVGRGPIVNPSQVDAQTLAVPAPQADAVTQDGNVSAVVTQPSQVTTQAPQQVTAISTVDARANELIDQASARRLKTDENGNPLQPTPDELLTQAAEDRNQQFNKGLESAAKMQAAEEERTRLQLPIQESYDKKSAQFLTDRTNVLDKYVKQHDYYIQQLNNAQQAALASYPNPDDLLGGKGSWARSIALGLAASAGGMGAPGIAALINNQLQMQVAGRNADYSKHIQAAGFAMQNADNSLQSMNIEDAAIVSKQAAALSRVADQYKLIAAQTAQPEIAAKYAGVASELYKKSADEKEKLATSIATLNLKSYTAEIASLRALGKYGGHGGVGGVANNSTNALTNDAYRSKWGINDKNQKRVFVLDSADLNTPPIFSPTEPSDKFRSDFDGTQSAIKNSYRVLARIAYVRSIHNDAKDLSAFFQTDEGARLKQDMDQVITQMAKAEGAHVNRGTMKFFEEFTGKSPDELAAYFNKSANIAVAQQAMQNLQELSDQNIASFSHTDTKSVRKLYGDKLNLNGISPEEKESINNAGKAPPVKAGDTDYSESNAAEKADRAAEKAKLEQSNVERADKIIKSAGTFTVVDNKPFYGKPTLEQEITAKLRKIQNPLDSELVHPMAGNADLESTYNRLRQAAQSFEVASKNLVNSTNKTEDSAKYLQSQRELDDYLAAYLANNEDAYNKMSIDEEFRIPRNNTRKSKNKEAALNRLKEMSVKAKMGIVNKLLSTGGRL